MIGWLKGKVISSDGEQVLLDVSGVGYEITATAGVFASDPRKGQPLELIIYTDVRENAISLFGFADVQEKQVFLLLKKVKGLGSKLAMAVVSTIGPRALLQSVAIEDVAMLTRVPGVGKKSAERIIVELREKVADLVTDVSPDALHGKVETLKPSSRAAFGAAGSDAVMALEKLGFSSQLACDAVSGVLAQKTSSQMDAGEILRKALASL